MPVRVVVLAGLLVACARTAPAPAPSPAPAAARPCDELRTRLMEAARENVDHVTQTATLPEEVKHAGVTAIVDAQLAICVSDRWTAAQVACLLEMKREVDCGIPRASSTRMSEAADAAWTRAFGDDADDELEQFAREQEAILKAHEEAKAKAAATPGPAE